MERISKNKCPPQKCPTCKKKCTDISETDISETSSSIVLVEGPKVIHNVSKNENEFQLRIWSYMAPPRISETVSLINPIRLEKVKELLNGTIDDTLETHIDSKVNIQVLADGTIRKMKSRTEYKRYPPVLRIEQERQLRRYCLPDCTVAEEYVYR